MRIINLVENTEGRAGCGAEHGLSFYIETEHHKLLMDTGQSDLFIQNAEKLGIDLTKVDTVVLSHGHYDHGGGILPFAEINRNAKIYVPEAAFGDYYSVNKDGEPHYIGLAKEIQELPQIVLVEAGNDICRIDDELSLFSGIGDEHPIPSTNRRLKVKTEEGLIQDDFRHEQCLVISEGNKKVLLSGCAHHGILNVLERYYELYGGEPDVVISGFHMMRKNGYPDEDINMIIDTALELRGYQTVFYTGHCTGVEPYTAMKKLMGDQLQYVHSGDEIRIRTKLDNIMWNAEERAASGHAEERAASGHAEERAASGNEEDQTPSTNAESGNAADSGFGYAEDEKVEYAREAAGKKRREYMKWHKFFAWGTVACFVLTMVTGYKRK